MGTGHIGSDVPERRFQGASGAQVTSAGRRCGQVDRYRTLARLNEAAGRRTLRVVDAARLSLRPGCIRDQGGVLFWAILHIWKSHNRAL
jgi:hypothetical protein